MRDALVVVVNERDVIRGVLVLKPARPNRANHSTMRDLVGVGVSILTLGQYLRPSAAHLPVEKYYHPDEFAELAEHGRALGFTHVESGPLVRSSYHAKKQADTASESARTDTASASARTDIASANVVTVDRGAEPHLSRPGHPRFDPHSHPSLP